MGNAVKWNVDGRLWHKQESLVQKEEMAFVCLERALDTRLLVVADKVAGRRGNLSARETLEDLGNNLVGRVLVVHLELAVVLLLERLLGDVEIKLHIFLALELHNQERILCLSLPQRGLETNHNHVVDLVGLGKKEELFDILEWNLVIVSLTAQAERRLVHVDIVTTSGLELEVQFKTCT